MVNRCHLDGTRGCALPLREAEMFTAGAVTKSRPVLGPRGIRADGRGSVEFTSCCCC